MPSFPLHHLGGSCFLGIAGSAKFIWTWFLTSWIFMSSFASSLRRSVSDWRRLAGADFSPLPGPLTLLGCCSHPCIPVSSVASLITRTSAVPCAVFSCHKHQLSESQFSGSWKNNWVVSLCRDDVQTPPPLGYPALAKKNVFQGLFSKQRVCCTDRCSPLTSCWRHEMVVHSCLLR